MSKRSSRHSHQLGVLKTALIAGAVTATMAGTRLLAAAEPLAAAASIETSVPAAGLLPQSDLPPSLDQTLGSESLNLRPIPQAVSPNIRAVTRSRSSR